MRNAFRRDVARYVQERLYRRIWMAARDQTSYSVGASIPTKKELKARQALLRKLKRMRAKTPPSSRRFPSTEEMLREDRAR